MTLHLRSLCIALTLVTACGGGDDSQPDAAPGVGFVAATWTLQLNGAPATCTDLYPATHVRLEVLDGTTVIGMTEVDCGASTATVANVPAGSYAAHLCVFYKYPGEYDHCYGAAQVGSFDVVGDQTASLTDLVVASCKTGGGLPQPC